MRTIIATVFALMLAFVGAAQAQPMKSADEIRAETKAMLANVWYSKEYKGNPITSMREALSQSMSFHGPDHVGWTKNGDGEVCKALKGVKLGCDYNTRYTLSMFLTVNGKGLFPAAGNTNPYFTKFEPEYMDHDDGFIGRLVQNKMLADAIRRNTNLFKGGDLSADDVKKRWR